MTAQTNTEINSDRGRTFQLPPLILHPFAEPAAPQRLVESSRANLMINGLLPAGDHSPNDLERKLLDGRYSELRMLFYVGKDLVRWMEQCVDSLSRAESGLPAGVTVQSFASLLIQHTPESVATKLRKWNVNDFKSIFTRSIGLNSIFAEAPIRGVLSDEFVRHYYRYADQLFLAWQSKSVYTQLDSTRYPFELFSSGEYSRLLERAWE